MDRFGKRGVRDVGMAEIIAALALGAPARTTAHAADSPSSHEGRIARKPHFGSAHGRSPGAIGRSLQRTGASAAALVLAMIWSVWAPAVPARAEEGGGTAGVQAAISPKLGHLLALLADRAALHQSLLYRFQCTEDLTRRVMRKKLLAGNEFLPEESLHDRCGIVVEQGEEKVAKVVRVKLDRKGQVRLDRKGEPLEAVLSQQFGPVLNAVPHAQAATFTANSQTALEFRLLEDIVDDGTVYRIKCPMDHVSIEFLDRRPPRLSATCHAEASGQMCVDPHSGEISALVFYSLDREPDGCYWNRALPFAMVEQGFVEARTGARFPSRVKTIYSVDRRNAAVFEQRYENCGFTQVDMKESYGGVTPGSAHP